MGKKQKTLHNLFHSRLKERTLSFVWQIISCKICFIANFSLNNQAFHS